MMKYSLIFILQRFVFKKKSVYWIIELLQYKQLKDHYNDNGNDDHDDDNAQYKMKISTCSNS